MQSMVVTKVVRSINRNNEASCYGYGQTGDVIDLTAQLTGLNARDAAR